MDNSEDVKWMQTRGNARAKDRRKKLAARRLEAIEFQLFSQLA